MQTRHHGKEAGSTPESSMPYEDGSRDSMGDEDEQPTGDHSPIHPTPPGPGLVGMLGLG